MKLTIILLLISVCALGQSPVNPYKQVADQNKKPEPTIAFDVLNGAYIQDADNAAKYLHRADSTKWAIVRTILQIKKIDFARLGSGDSTLVTPEGIFLKLKQ